MSTTLDTLQVAKDLQAASFSEQQAEALVRLLRERQQVDLAQAATKADLALLATRVDLAEVKTEILMWLIGLLLAQTAAIVAFVKLLP